MKRIILFTLTALFCLPAFTQRLKVVTTTDTSNYKKNYSHTLEYAEENDSLNLYIVGNLTDDGEENERVTVHKIHNMNLKVNRYGEPDPATEYKIHFSDFNAYPSDEFRYAAGTGIYYPTGYDDEGYPFLGIYDKDSLNIVSLDYFNVSYGGVDTMHAIGLRVKYSPESSAYYICGTMLNKRLGEIDLTDIRARSKGFIMKIDENGQYDPRLIVFEPDSVDSDAWLSVVSDIEINSDEDKIAFTGLNTKSELTGYLHPMAGIVDMGLTPAWCMVYEITTDSYGGMDVVFNENDTTLFVLMNSTGPDCSVMELDSDNGSVVQGPWSYEFSGNLTSNDTTRAHMMHFVNNSLIITGNHFATESSTRYQYLYRFDVRADTLRNFDTHFTYYSKQQVPRGDQKYVYSYWAPENSVYQQNNLHLVGVCNEFGDEFGFKYVSVNGISNSCVDTLSPDTDTPYLDDTISCTYEMDRCNEIDEDVEYGNQIVSDTLECVTKQSSLLETSNYFIQEDDIWQLKKVDHTGINAILISERPATYKVNIYDIMGREVFQSNYRIGKGQTSIRMEFELEPIIYIIKVSDGNKIEVKRIIKP